MQSGRWDASDGLSARENLQLAFWEGFTGEVAARRDAPLKTRSPTHGGSYKQYFLPGGDVRYDLAVDPDEGRLRCTLLLGGATDLYAHLSEQRDEIESEIGDELLWNPDDDELDPVVVREREADVADSERWDEYFDWLIDSGARFSEAFGPRIEAFRGG